MSITLEETHMNLFQRYLAEEFAEDYQEGRLSRREALKLIASVTGSLIAANSVLASCAPQESAETATVPTTESPATQSLASDTPTDASSVPQATASSAYGTV